MASYKPVPDGQQEAPPRRNPAPPVPHSTSETDPLLEGRRTPPPRYSTIGPSWLKTHIDELPQSDAANVNSTSTTAPPPRPPPPATGTVPSAASTACPQQALPQSTFAYPGWWTWVPGPAQLFPPGLEHLTTTDSLTVMKKGRRYRVLKDNQQIYSVKRIKQDNGEVILKLMNNANLDVLILTRNMEARGCCSSNTHVEVCFPPGNTVGVVQGGALEYTVHNPSGDLLFHIEREQARCRGKPGYQVSTRERLNMGSISRYKPSCCSSRKVMLLTFPQELDLRYKALLLAGAVILRDTHW